MDFKKRLFEILKIKVDAVLIEDEAVKWTGRDILDHFELLNNKYFIKLPERSRIALCFPNQGVFALTIICTYLSGHIPVLVNYIDVSEDNPYLFFQNKNLENLILENSLLTKINITDHKQNKTSIHFFHSVMKLDRFATITDSFLSEELISFKNKSVQVNLNSNKDTFAVLYTSGSTGDSKPIPVPAEGIEITADYLNSYFKLTDKDVATVVLPICFSMSLNTQFIPTLLLGARSIFINSRLNYMKLYSLILESQGTSLALIGDVLQTCWEQRKKKNLPSAVHVKHVQLAGGPVLPEYVKMAQELFPNAIIYKGYGLTEAIRVAMIDSRDPDFTTNCVGHPLPFVQLKIEGDQGEIYVKGPNVMVGHENEFFPTGDFGYLNEAGQLIVLGRRDGVFKISGQRIAGSIFENLALQFSQLVKSAKCLAVYDKKRLTQKIVLFLEIEPLKSVFEIHKNDIFRDFENKLKAHSFYPKDIVLLNRFPRTSNGKIKLSELQMLWQNDDFNRINVLPNSILRWYSPESLVSELNIHREINYFLNEVLSSELFERVSFFKFEFHREWSSKYENYRSHIREAILATDPGILSHFKNSILDLNLVPEHPACHISISHCKEIGGYALVDKTFLVGIDVEGVERVNSQVFRRISNVRDVQELPFLHPSIAWVAKESAFKAISKKNNFNVISEIAVTSIKEIKPNIYNYSIDINNPSSCNGEGFVLITDQVCFGIYIQENTDYIYNVYSQHEQNEQFFAEDLVYNLNMENIEL